MSSAVIVKHMRMPVLLLSMLSVFGVNISLLLYVLVMNTCVNVYVISITVSLDFRTCGYLIYNVFVNTTGCFKQHIIDLLMYGNHSYKAYLRELIKTGVRKFGFHS